MKDARPIEVQVAELTQAQQDTIIKVGKLAVILEVVGLIPMFASFIWFFANAFSSPLDFGKYAIIFLTILVVCFLYILGVFIYFKRKYPYYSDAKWQYINKKRKENNK